MRPVEEGHNLNTETVQLRMFYILLAVLFV